MRIYTLIFLLPIYYLVICNTCYAQTTFQITYDGLDGRSAISTFDGGYIIVGSANNTPGYIDVHLIKTDSIGNKIWTKSFGGSGGEWGRSVIQTSDSGYAVLGLTSSFGAGDQDMYFIRTDSSGNLIWSKTYGWLSQDRGISVKQTFDGGFIFTGDSWYLGGFSGNHLYIVRTNSIGDTLWTKVIRPQISGIGTCVIQTADSGFAITGELGSDVCLVRLDSIGSLLWIKTYGGTEQDFGNSIQQTTDGGFIISSTAWSFGGAYKLFLIKTDSVGDLTWSKAFGVGGSGGQSVQQTDDGGYIISGFLDCPIGNRNVYLIKTDALGDTLWSRTFGGANNDSGHSVSQTSDGGYILSGTTESFGISNAIYLIKTDSVGISGCNESICTISVSTPQTQVGTQTNSYASGGIVTVPQSIVTIGGSSTTLCLYSTLPEIIPPDEIINIYPNPSNGTFFLRSHKLGILNVIIYNTLGEIIHSEVIKNTSRDVSNQMRFQSNSGIYFVIIHDGVNYHSKKLIID